jgi:hypothetical protein
MKKFLIGLGVFIGLLLIVNFFVLEPVAKHYVNKELDKLEEYKGSIEDIDIALWRGAYKIEGLNIVKKGSEAPEPFFASSLIDLSVQWSALFKGEIVGEIVITDPILNFAVQPSSGEVQNGGNNDWVQTVKNLIPLQINRFEILNGNIKYKDPTSSPKVFVGLKKLHLLATNLGNADDSGELLPSHLLVDSEMSGNGKLNIEADLNALKQTPDFDLTMKVDDLDLSFLKDFTNAYAGFTFKEGQLFISSEVAMKDGVFEGYVKPILENTRVIDLDNENSSFWRKAWEVVVGGVLELFENQRKDQFATRVPFSGNVNETEVGTMSTLANVLKNAFINAFEKNIQGSINIESVTGDEEKDTDKGFFEELFDGEEES